MGASVLQLGTSISCQHGAPAVPQNAATRVLLEGQPALTIASVCLVAGCPSIPPAGAQCAIGRFVTGAVRVFAGGVSVALQNSLTSCDPTGLPMTVVSAQSRVTAV